MQVFCWCIVAAMHQNEGIGANRLMKACNEMEEFEAKYATAIPDATTTVRSTPRSLPPERSSSKNMRPRT